MENLPANVCAKIFGHLDKKTLKAVGTTNSTLRDVVFKSTKLMANYKLLISNYKDQKPFIEKYGSSFRSVKMFSSTGPVAPVFTFEDIEEILSTITKVRELEIGRIKMRFRRKVLKDINLPDLKILKLTGNAIGYRITNFLTAVSVKELHLIDENSTVKNFDSDFLSWLMQVQDQLKILHVQGNACKLFASNYNFTRARFRLNTFLFENYQDKPFWTLKTMTNLWKFLISQQAIENVAIIVKQNEIPESTRVTYLSLLHYVLKYSTKFTVPVDNASFDWYLDAFKYLQVDSLELYSTYQQSNEIIFCEDCKKMRLYLARYADHVALQFINRALKNLKFLKIFRHYDINRSENFTNFKLSNLQKLTLTYYLPNEKDWQLLTQQCPLIEEVSLNVFILTTEMVKLMCSEWKQFSRLELGFGFYEPDIICPLIDQPKRKTVAMNAKMRSHFETILENAGRITIILKENNADEYVFLTEFSINNFFRRHQKLKGQMRLLDNGDY